MHTLVTILARKENNESKSEFRKRIRDEFEYRYVDGSVFDYSITDTAGIWSDEYPDNIFIGDDIIKHLEKIAKYQKETEKEITEQIECRIGNGSIGIPEKGGLLFWYLVGELSDRKLGNYTLSCPEFICLDDGNSIVTDDIIQDVEEHPGEYGILLADCHF